jgi:WD40 repeat protein
LVVRVSGLDAEGRPPTFSYRTDPQGEWQPVKNGAVEFPRPEAGSVHLEVKATDPWGGTSEPVTRDVSVGPNPWSGWRQLGESKVHDQVGALRGLAFSPGGTMLAGAAADNTVRLWRTADGETLDTLDLPGLTVTDKVDANPAAAPVGVPFGGPPLAPGPGIQVGVPPSPSKGRTKTAGRKTARPGAATVSTGSDLHSLAYSPDGDLLACGEDSWVRLWHAANGEPAAALREPGGAVASLAFSADGKLLAAGTAGGTVSVWNVATSQPLLRSAGGHGGPVLCLAFNPAGTQLVSGGEDKMLNLWDVGRAEQPKLLGMEIGAVRCLAFSPDGALLAVGGDGVAPAGGVSGLPGLPSGLLPPGAGPGVPRGGSPSASLPFGVGDANPLQIWDIAERRLARGLAAGGPVQSVAFTKDGSVLASGGDNGGIRLFRPQTGQLLLALEGHRAVVHSLAFLGDGATLASGSGDGVVRLWGPGAAAGQGGEPTLEIAHVEPTNAYVGDSLAVRLAALSPAGDSQLRYEYRASPAAEWRPAKDGAVHLDGVKEDVRLEFRAVDGKGRLSKTKDASWTVAPNSWPAWRALAFPPPAKEQADPGPGLVVSDVVTALAFSSDGALLAVGSRDGWVKFCPLPAGKPLLFSLKVPHAGPVAAVAFKPGTKEAISAGGSDKKVVLWQVSAVRIAKMTSLPPDEDSNLCVAYSPDGRYVASGNRSGRISLADGPAGRNMAGHEGGVAGLAFAGDTLISAGEDRALRYWRADTGEMTRALEGLPGPVKVVAFNADRSLAACGLGDEAILVVRLADGQVLHRLEGHTGRVTCLAFAKDGDTLVSGGEDRTIRFWRMVDGRPWHAITGLADPPCGLLFTPDGKRLVGGVGKAVQSWGAAGP